VIEYPEILGEGVIVVTFEFDRWWTPGGVRERDRLDVLGIDLNGRLVVAELKRDRAPDTVEMHLAENVALSFSKCMRVVVNGGLEQRGWEAADGEHRSKLEIVADEISPSMRFATADVRRVKRREEAKSTS